MNKDLRVLVLVSEFRQANLNERLQFVAQTGNVGLDIGFGILLER